jgi:hypothetical protein
MRSWRHSIPISLADPPVETTHWTADLMARASGISASAVRRIWKAHGLEPHRYRQFKLSGRPRRHRHRPQHAAATAIRSSCASWNAIEAEVPAGKMVHVILDNYAAHKQPKVRAWLDRHERFVFHFTPTSCSWLNAVECFFARLSRRRLKRGVFRSVGDLQAAINRFLAETNAEPKPYWGLSGARN